MTRSRAAAGGNGLAVLIFIVGGAWVYYTLFIQHHSPTLTCVVTKEGSAGKPRADYAPENKYAVGDYYTLGNGSETCWAGDREIERR